MQNLKNFKYLGLAMAGLPLATAAQSSQETRPNIIVILADDMGYSDIGCYGGEIETPNINSLAENGLRWRQFYNNARSCPSRAVLMTGLYPHQAGMGWMANADLGTPAYQGRINNNCVTIAEVLSSAGYGTYMAGKWHLSSDRQNSGNVPDNWPIRRGFDRFYGIPGGAANYFDAQMMNDETRERRNDDDFYFTHAISDSAAAFVARHDYDEKPLFLYLAFTAPHWPLHALQKDIDKYVERYKAGWDKLREERFERQKEMGLFDEDAVLSPRDASVVAWDELTPEAQEEYVMRMAIYAAQIDALDQGVGKVIKALKDRGQFDNTVIMFMSDNGACAEYISSGKRKAVDGKVDTYESYRINWANLSSTPYREYKHFTNEGGIASPLVVSYPNGIAKSDNGKWVDEYGYFADIMATCVDLSHAQYPKKYKGNKIVPMQGVSLVPNFTGGETGRGLTFWEHEANIAVRDGKWKIVTKTPEGQTFDPAKIELYDMESDPTELHNLAASDPERVARMYKEWKKWANKVGVFPMDTREYGVRANASKREHINGSFDDNFGGWNLSAAKTADVKYYIDTVNTIKGSKTARIEIGRNENDYKQAAMAWAFPVDEPSVATFGFTAKADKPTSVILRFEKDKDPENVPFEQTITLGTKTKRINAGFDQAIEPGRYRFVIYFGESDPSTIWIDEVKMDVEAKELKLASSKPIEINGEFDNGYTGWDPHYSRDVKVNFSIDENNIISGKNSARIEIEKNGERPNTIWLKRMFTLDSMGTASFSFQAKSSEETKIFVRIENPNDIENKAFDQEFTLNTNIQTFKGEFTQPLPSGNHQFVFYMGTADPSTIWIDNVKMDVKTYK